MFSHLFSRGGPSNLCGGTRCRSSLRFGVAFISSASDLCVRSTKLSSMYWSINALRSALFVLPAGQLHLPSMKSASNARTSGGTGSLPRSASSNVARCGGFPSRISLSVAAQPNQGIEGGWEWEFLLGHEALSFGGALNAELPTLERNPVRNDISTMQGHKIKRRILIHIGHMDMLAGGLPDVASANVMREHDLNFSKRCQPLKLGLEMNRLNQRR